MKESATANYCCSVVMVSVIFIIITIIGIAFPNKSKFLSKYPVHLSLSLV